MKITNKYRTVVVYILKDTVVIIIPPSGGAVSAHAYLTNECIKTNDNGSQSEMLCVSPSDVNIFKPFLK